MPTNLVTDDSLPALAARFPLAATLLSAWEHDGSLLGNLMLTDALHTILRRSSFGIPTILPGR